MAGLLGNIFGAIGKNQAPDIQSRPLSQLAEPLYNKLFEDYAKVGSAASGDLDKFRTQFTSLTPQLAALDQLHSSLYGNLLDQAKTYDPTKNLTTSGNYLFGNLDKYLNTGLQAGNAAMKQNLAAAGYGDRGPTGYGALLNANRITSNLLPAFSGIVNALPSLSAQQNMDYFRNLAQLPGWMQGQTEALQATPYRALVPSQMERSDLLANLNALNQINAGNLSNRYFYNKPNIYSTIGDVASGAYQGLGDAMDLVNKASSTYGNLMGSGLGGQMGIQGGQQQQGSNIDINQILNALGKNGAGGGMGGGGGGGINISQILGLLQQLGVGQQSNLGGGSPLNQGQYPGESLPSMGVAQINPYQNNGSVYGPVGIGGYLQYNPNTAVGSYLNQNPYSQYGGYFQ